MRKATTRTGKSHGRCSPPFYSFTIAGWQILSLNSEAPHGRQSAQLRWLRRAVLRPGTCGLAFWHRPRYGAGTVHGDQADVAPLWDALRRHVRIVVNGHEHDMQRFRGRDGVVEFVSGAGGHEHYLLPRDDRRLAFANYRVYGALRLELQPGAARYAFIAADGRTLDAGRISCVP